MTIGHNHIRHTVGLCPARQQPIDVLADVEVVPTMVKSLDPERPMVFEGKVTGAKVQDHDCRPKVQRGARH